MKKIRIIFLLFSLFLTAFVHAHGAGHAARHGGKVIEAGDYTLEWVARENALYLGDHTGADIPADGASGKIVAVSGSGKATITLSPAGGNRLNLSAPLPAGNAVKAVISIALPGRAPLQARLEGTLSGE